MARGYIATVDPVHRRRVNLGPGTHIAWSSAHAWSGLVLEKFVHDEFETPEFVIDQHCLVLHVSPAVNVEHKIHGVYRRFLHGPGNICLFSAGTPRQIRSTEPHAVLALAISPGLIGRSVGEPGLAQRLTLVEHRELRDGRIQHILRGLELEAEDGYPSGALFGESLGLGLARHLSKTYAIDRPCRSETKGGMAPRALRRVVDYIESNLHEDIRLSALASVAGLSEYRFAHNFKGTTGSPPYRYVMTLKIARAKQLLRETKLSVTEIGQALGFTRASRFSSAFGRFTGTTPSAYRNAAD